MLQNSLQYLTDVLLCITLTLWTLMMLPQSSMYCFRSFSWWDTWKDTKRERKRINIIWPLKTHIHTCTVQTLTRYSNTSVRHLSVWIMSWRVTILACFKSFSSDTRRGRHIRDCQSNTDNLWGELKQLMVHLQLRELQGNTGSQLLYVPTTLSKPDKLIDNMVPCRPVSCLLRITWFKLCTFSDGCAGRTLLMLQSDLFQSY